MSCKTNSSIYDNVPQWFLTCASQNFFILDMIYMYSLDPQYLSKTTLVENAKLLRAFFFSLPRLTGIKGCLYDNGGIELQFQLEADCFR